MGRKRALITGAALVALVVVVYLWWPSVLLGLQGFHGPFGGALRGIHGGQ
jgi:hypothetical protein